MHHDLHMHPHINYSESWWDMNLLIGLLATIIFYLLTIHLLENKYRGSIIISNSQIIVFLLACSIFYVSFGSPMATHSHHYLSVHMLQMSIISFVIPPMLIFSLPYIFLKKFVPLLKYPIFGVVFFAILFSSYHVPTAFNWLMSSHQLHIASHLILFGAAIMMWLPLTPVLVKKILGLNERKYMHYVMWFVMPPCIFLLIMNVELYALLDTPNKLFSNLMDQRISGIIMISLHQLTMVANAWVNKRKHIHQTITTYNYIDLKLHKWNTSNNRNTDIV